MSTTPYALVQASVNLGAWASGGITAALGDSLRLRGESTVGWTSARWEVIGPPGWAIPAGWTDVGGKAVYLGGTEQPPAFVMNVWGKYMPTLTVNDGRKVAGATSAADVEMVYTATAISVPSANGVIDIGVGETTQFSTLRAWVGSLQDISRKVDATFSVVAGASGGHIWNSAVTYVIGDVVGYLGTTYVAIAGGANHQPPNPSYWAPADAYGGPWNAATPYPIGALVTLSGVIYRATATSMNQTPPNGSYWAAVGLTGFSTLLDLDFAAQSSQTLGSDGTFTIASIPFLMEGRSRVASAALTNGTGLTATSSSTNTEFLFAGARNAFQFGCRVIDVDPLFNHGDVLRVWSRLVLTNADANYEVGGMALENRLIGSGSTAFHGFGVKRGYYDALAHCYQFYAPGTAVNDQGDIASATDDVMMIEMAAIGDVFRVYTGSWSSGWPALSSMKRRRTYRQTQGTTSTMATPGSVYMTLFNGNVVGGNHTTTWPNLRFDVKRGS